MIELVTIAEASPTHPLRTFGPYVPSVGVDGRVAFQATRADGTSTVLVGDGAEDAQALAISEPFRGHEVVSHPAVGEAGIAWFGKNGSRDVLLLHRDGVTDALLDAPDPGIEALGPLGPTIDDAGAVAFRATVHGRPAAGVVRDGIVELFEDGTLPRLAGLPLSSDGALVLRADDLRGRNVLLRVRGNEQEVLLATGRGLASLGSFPCADGARVACGVRRADGTEALVEVLPDPQHVRVILEAGVDFESLRGGLVAGPYTVFYATPHGGELAVYALERAPRRILGLGDRVEGSRIADLALNPVSIHRAGWLAIRIALEDGRERIVRARLDDPSR